MPHCFMRNESFNGLIRAAPCLPAAAASPIPAGSWKLAGFGFSAPLDYAAAPGQSVYDYSNLEPTLLQQATQVWMMPVEQGGLGTVAVSESQQNSWLWRCTIHHSCTSTARWLQPPLPFVAPELVASGSSGVTGAADVFSLG